ncbi:hypothetical protein A2U01_0015049, partial [Trifolium medium]|nr:hypothetical protein [Trifolium medium]
SPQSLDMSKTLTSIGTFANGPWDWPPDLSFLE